MPDVPLLDKDSVGGEDSSQRNELEMRVKDTEFRILAAELESIGKLNREADQRYRLRLIAVRVAIVLVIFVGCVLLYSSYKILSPKHFEVPSSYIIATYVAPIASMTAITIALLVAAFRGFKDGDEKNTVSAMVEGTRASGGVD